jgi:hypothetical protein
MIVERNDTRPNGREIKTLFSDSDKNKKEYGPGMAGPSNRGKEEAEAQKLDDAYYDKVNIGKTCDIAVLTEIDVNNTDFTSFDFGNWRENGANNIFDVSQAVTLLSDSTKFKNGYSYVVQDYVSTAENSGGIKNYKSALDKIQSSMNGANQITSLLNEDIGSYYVPKTFIPRYRNFKLMSDYKIENLDSITFNFTFGQAHLFSGEEEVVKPILALANIFAPVKQPNDDGNIHGYSSPALKTVNEFLTRFYTASSSRLRGFIGQLKGGAEAKEAATDAAKSMGQKVGAELGMTGKVSELADNLKKLIWKLEKQSLLTWQKTANCLDYVLGYLFIRLFK